MGSFVRFCYSGSHYTLNIDFGDGSEVEIIYNNRTAETHTVKHTFHLPGDLSLVVTASNDVTDPAVQYRAYIDVQVSFLTLTPDTYIIQ